MARGPRVAMIALVVLAAACTRRDPLTSCEQSLAGTWRSDHGDAERWMILEHTGELEIYPLFPDRLPAAGLETAPRVIDLARTPSGITGDAKRRYLQRGGECIARAPVHVTACADDTLELVLADPAVPVGFTPCAYPRPDSSRRERWRRDPSR